MRFKAGDRVHHIGRREDGTVLPIEAAGIVRVEFDTPTSYGPSIGVFDRFWFEKHHGWLKLAPQPAPPPAALPKRHYKSNFVPS